MDNKKQQNEAPAPEPKVAFDWMESKTALPDVFSSHFHLNWSSTDVRILFGQLKPQYGHSDTFMIEERAAVTMSWVTAKRLLLMLGAVVGKYEEVNGEIVQPKLPDAPQL